MNEREQHNLNTPILDATELRGRTLAELHEIARELKIPSYRKFHKQDLLEEIIKMKDDGPNHGEVESAEEQPEQSQHEEEPALLESREDAEHRLRPVEAVTIEREVEPGQLPM